MWLGIDRKVSLFSSILGVEVLTLKEVWKVERKRVLLFKVKSLGKVEGKARFG